MGRIILFSLFFACAIIGYAEADYIAAVLEYHPINNTSPNQTIEENLREYLIQINFARKKSAQIIVFPEYGLTGLVIEPEDYSLEIPEVGASEFQDDFLKRLSYAAIQDQIYVVVNLLEKARDEKNKTVYYNTNIVFNKQGSLVAKYRKINLFNEPNLTAGQNISTFTTDFGVTFGLITCFDILYHNPSRTILESGTVTDVIFPHAWHSLLPLYMSLSVQSAYSLAAKVNLLAANLNSPKDSIGGSGIYRRGRALQTVLTGKPETTLIYNSVGNIGRAITPFGFGFIDNDTVPDLTNYQTGRAFDTGDYEYKQLDLSKQDTTEQLCDGKFCCNFHITLSVSEVNQSEIYKLVTFDGKAPWGSGKSNVKFCGVVSCQTNDVNSCGYRPAKDLSTTFASVTVWGTFATVDYDLYQPASVLGNLRPIDLLSYEETRTNTSVSASLNTTRAEKNIVFLGLYGRGGAPALAVNLVVVVAAMIAKFVL